MSLKINNCGPLLIILLIALLIVTNVIVWWPTLGQFFVYDDFFLLDGAANFSIHKFLRGTNGSFLRPISTFWLFFPMRNIFGLNPFYYHVVLLFFHILTALIIFWCAYQIVKNEYIGFLSSFLWSVHLSHFTPLSWIAGFQDLSMTLFFFLSFGLYLSWRNNETNRLKYFFSIISFSLSIFSQENAIVYPLLLIIYEIVNPSKKGLKIFVKLIPYFLISALYFILFKWYFVIPEEGPYKMGIGRHSLVNLIQYIFWSDALSFANPFNCNPLLTFPDIPISKLSALIATGINIFLAYIGWKSHDKWAIIFLLLWFFVGISIFLLLPFHIYAYYAIISLFGFLLVICIGLWHLFIKYKPKTIGLVIVLIITLSSAIIVRNQYQTSWLPIHARFAEQTLSFLKQKYKTFPSNTEIYLLNFADKLVPSIELALMQGIGLKVLFDQNEIKTFFFKREEAIHFLSSHNNLKYFTEGKENRNKIILQIFPRQWTEKVINGGIGEINDKIGQIECKTSSWRKFSNGSEEYGSEFTGDFEIVVDFDLTSFPSPSKDHVETGIALEVEGDRYSFGRWRDTSGLDAYWMWGGGVPNTYIATKDNAGRLRARRVGSTLYSDFWDGVKWVNMGSRPVKRGTAYLSLMAFNSTSKKHVNVRFSNFKVVSGETLFSKYYSKEDSIILD